MKLEDKRQAYMNIDGKKVLIDVDCVNMVKMFNRMNITTQYCCSGHNRNDKDFYIAFSPTVSDCQILDLICMFDDAIEFYNNLNGRFIKYIGESRIGKLDSCWCYRVANMEMANEDYEKFMKV